MLRLYARLSLFVFAASAGCFSPDYGAVGFACGSDPECPSGYFCHSDGRCHDQPEGNSGPDGGSANPPANDSCATAELLASGSGKTGTLKGAADDVSSSCVSSGQPDVFYTFTLNSAQQVTLTLSSSFDTAVTLMQADCSTVIACADDGDAGATLVEDNLAAGTYVVAVDAVTATTGDFSLLLELDAPIVRPSNDSCDAATALTPGGGAVSATALNALDDATPACEGTAAGDVAFEFTVPAGSPMHAVVSVTNAVGFDPVVYLQQGCGGAFADCSQYQLGDGSDEVLDIPSLDPGTYTVWVDAVGSTPSTFDIAVDLSTAIDAPGNDVCSMADALVAGNPTAGSTAGATDDYDLTCADPGSRDTVHSFSLGADAAVLVTIEPDTDWDLAASLRANASCETTDLSCIGGAYGPRYFNRPNLGTGDYDVIVSGAGGDYGDYTITYETAAVDTTFGYWLLSSSGQTYTALGACGGSVTCLTVGDEVDSEVSMPFDFDFFGSTKSAASSMWINSNGFVTFADPTGLTASTKFTNDCSLDDSTPYDMIAVFWDDLVGNPGGTLKYQVQGVAPYRRLVIEWRDWNIFASNGVSIGTSIEHQLILHENGDIEMRYGSRTDPGGGKKQQEGDSATIGLRSASGSVDIDEAQCNTPTISAGDVYYFVHPR